MSFSSALKRWYSVNKRDLPWRNTKDPYRIWLSEVILQQTQVAQGMPYYNKFLAAYATITDLANAPEDEVLKLWQGLGYYSRARNLHYTAKYVSNELNSVFPSDYRGLIKLKGVGDYTASAIASICFDKPNAVVDGNVYRVLSRYFGIYTPINSTKGAKEFKLLAQEVLDLKDPATHNQSMMEFGARQCKPKAPNCDICPLNDSCIALKENKVHVLPVKIKKLKVSKKYYNFAVFVSDNHQTILEKRLGDGIWRNLYQFPLIETENEACEYDIREALHNFSFFKNELFDLSLYNEQSIIHKLSHQHLYTKFWIIRVKTIKEGIDFEDLNKYPVPVLIANFIEAYNF